MFAMHDNSEKTAVTSFLRCCAEWEYGNAQQIVNGMYFVMSAMHDIGERVSRK